MINKSKTYLAPLILLRIPEIEFSNIQNTYLKVDYKLFEDSLYLLYKKTKQSIKSLYTHPLIEEIVDVGEYYLIELVIPEDINFEYLCFKRGKYSYYRPHTKELVINYLYSNVGARSRNVIEKAINIFSKNPMYKEHLERTLDVRLEETAELGSIVDLESETFRSVLYGQFTKIKEGNTIII